MTATNALSFAILRRRYQAGVPKTQFTEFPVVDEIEKYTDFVGDDYAIALQGENPQGLGTTIPNAQGAAAQSIYRRFLLTRLEYFGIARIKGQALRTATLRGDGALVDLWTRELEGIEAAFMKMLEIISMRFGNGVLATLSSGVGTATGTLSVVEDINCIDIGMPLRMVSDTTLSPTVRSGRGVVTGVNRAAGTITFGDLISNIFAGAANGDSFVRDGDQALAGVASVPQGLLQWNVGGSSPGTLYGLNRNEDTVRYASQALDMTGLPMAEAILDLDSLITIQGHKPKKRLICNPRDVRQVKKTLFGKVMLSSGGGTPTVGFDGAKWAGANGDIPSLESPFCPKTNVFLKDMSTFGLYSAGGAPMPMNFGKENMITLATDDAAESRIGVYGNFADRMPVNSARGTNWGVV